MGTVTSYNHRSVGPTLVSWPSTAVPLGYADDRIMIDERPFYEDIRNDGFGGAAGMPSDVQYLGSIAVVTMNLNRFNHSNITALGDLDATNANIGNDTIPYDGEMPEIGAFVRQDILWGSLALQNRTETRTFPKAFLRQGRRFNVGVRHQIYTLVFECHVDDPCTMVLYEVTALSDPCSSS